MLTAISRAFHRKAMDLLLKLDPVQGGDPMIGNGKRSISRDIIRFIGCIDRVSVKRNEASSTALKNKRFGGTANKSRVLYTHRRIGTTDLGDSARDEKVLMEELGDQVENIHGFSRVSGDDSEESFELENPRISINGKAGSSQSRNGCLVKRPAGIQPKAKKSVSFADNENVSSVFQNMHEPMPVGDSSNDWESFS